MQIIECWVDISYPWEIRAWEEVGVLNDVLYA